MNDKQIEFEIFRNLPGVAILLKYENNEYIIVEVTNDFAPTPNERKRLIGENLFKAFPDNPDDNNASGAANLKRSLEIVIATRSVHKMAVQRYDIENANGIYEEHYWQVINKPMFDTKGDIKYIIHLSENVTDKINIEQRAKTSEQNLKVFEEKHIINKQAYNLFMQAPVGFSLMRGDDHVYEITNQLGLLLIGLDSENIIGRPFSEILPGPEFKESLNILNKVKHEGQTITIQEMPVSSHQNALDKTRYFNVVYQPYYENDKIEGVICISTEVTEQVKGKQSLEEMKDRFENMANNLPNLSWIANSDGWIFWYNKRWYEYTGTTPNDMEGWGWKSVHHPDTLPDVLDKWQSSIITGQPFEMVFPLRGADNIYRPFLTRVVPIKNKEGEIIRWIGTNTDITKQKEIEKMKENFLSMASHEIKTPITTIKAYAQIAQERILKIGDLESLGMLQKINGHVNKLTKIVEDLLDVTRIQKDRIEFTLAEVDFNVLVEELVNDSKRIITTHEIIYKPGNNVKVMVDHDKISQVVTNLISNAVKYSLNGQQIILTTTSINNGMQLSVKDFGIGISERDQNHIFDQFYRVTGDSQATYPGMGIGLFISADIIKRHSGKIWVESSLKNGSVFSIWLPAANLMEDVRK